MSNLKVIYDNAADRATLVASSTAGALAAANLQTDIKSDVWRSAGLTASLTATFASGEMIGGVILPFCNLTSTATIRVRLYTNVADAVAAYDSGAVLACASPALGLWGWGSPLGSNAYSYGGGAYGRHWITTPQSAKKVVINLDDSANGTSYIEVGRLVLGNYWSPTVNPDYGLGVGIIDRSKQFRNDSGDLMTDVGTRHRKQTLNLTQMSSTDRSNLWNILTGNGMSRPVMFSLFPDAADPTLEQTHQMYCKMMSSPMMNTPFFNRYNVPLDLEEI